MSVGVDYKLFWRLNPAKLKAFNKSYEMQFRRRMEEQEKLAFLNGIYVLKAISTIGKGKFPEKPIKFFDFDKKDSENSEEEIKKQREKLMLSLQIMQTNYELSKKAKDEP